MGRGQGRRHQRHRLPEPEPLPLPLDGYLAHRRADEGRHRRLAGSAHARPRSAGRECADSRQLRSRPASRSFGAGRSSGVSRRPRNIRAVSRHPRRGYPQSDAGYVLADVRRLGQGCCQRVHPADGAWRDAGCRYSGHRSAQLLVEHRVRGHFDSAELAGCRAGDVRGHRHAHLLHGSGQLRYACGRSAGACQAHRRAVQRGRRLLGRRGRAWL